MSDSDPITRLNAALDGRYRIESELGEGGMATAYLADDLKHERKVALKVLKPELAAVVGAERFLAEIKTTAKLSHPHILPLFDSGEADGFLFYVMPHVEGESLRDRLDREHQLPVDDAVQIAKNVAEALDYAHRQGVIHRDIKPANVLLLDGKPAISDFGIALAVGTAGQGRLTETGLSMGTPHYMSPEQATGDQTVSAATDIYALGAVLYEMLVGDPPYVGSTAQAILGKIIAGELASATKQRASVRANVDAAIRKALEKLPADRFAQARDFAQALADPGFQHGELVGAGSAGPWNRLTVGFAGLTAALAVTVIILSSKLLDPPTAGVLHFSVPVAGGEGVYLGGPDLVWAHPVFRSLTFSPDGNLLVYAAGGAEDSYLYMQRLDQEGADRMEGTGGAASPFFSPDGAWIAFVDLGGLRRVSVADGEVERITPFTYEEMVGFRGATWGDDGMIVGSLASGLFQVAATGGEPELVAEVDSVQGGRMLSPHMLPGSEALLFHVMPSNDPTKAEIVALDLATGTRKTLVSDAMDPRYVSTGHLLFVRQGELMAVGFNPERLEVEGQPVILVEDVMQAVFMPNSNIDSGAAQLAISAAGHIAYARGGVYPARSMRPLRITSLGDTVNLELDPGRYSHFRVSPDGNRLAFTVGPARSGHIGIHDLARGVTRLLNTGGFSEGSAVWSPDGRSLAFVSDRDVAAKNVYRVSADGSGEPERLAPSDRAQAAPSWSSNGVIAYLEGGDIWVLPPDGDPVPFFTSAGSETHPTFSPGGDWLAYRAEGGIYVRPYPGPGPAMLITDVGSTPAWSPDGRQIYFARDGVLMAVDVAPGDEFRAGRAAPLIDPWILTRVLVRSYDVFPDGSFVIALDDGESGRRELYAATQLSVVLNFFEELKARVPN